MHASYSNRVKERRSYALCLCRAVVLAAAVFGLGCADEVATSQEVVTSQVGPDGAMVALPGGGRLEIPAGALKEETTITIREIPQPDVFQFAPSGPFFRFEPDGLVFDEELTIELPFETPSEGPRPISVVWTDSSGQWTNLDSDVDTEAGTVTARVAHFSEGGLGTWATYGVCKVKDDCPSVSTCRTGATCKEETCVYQIANVGTACDDGDPLTSSDSCTSDGTCAGVKGDCVFEDDCFWAKSDCETGVTCNDDGICVFEYAPQGTQCSDSNNTTTDDACDGNGHCVGIWGGCETKDDCEPPAECQDSVACQDHACVYENAPTGVECDDGKDWTSFDMCNGTGTCISAAEGTCGKPEDCYLGQCQQDPTCIDGKCGSQPAPFGTPCDDGDPATPTDVCNGLEECVPFFGDLCETHEQCAPPGQCQQSVECIDKLCSYEETPEGESCDDGNPETSDDKCDGAGNCEGTYPKCTSVEQCPSVGQCLAVDECTADGQCLYLPVALGTPCDDGDPSTVFDACDGTEQCIGTSHQCTNVEQCPDQGTCVLSVTCPDGSCLYEFGPAGMGCDDGNEVSTEDVCDAQGKCAGKFPDCDPGDPDCIVCWKDEDCLPVGEFVCQNPGVPGALCVKTCSWVTDCPPEFCVDEENFQTWWCFDGLCGFLEVEWCGFDAYCEGGVCQQTCSPEVCFEGCCKGGKCQPGTEDTACGSGGGPCGNCITTFLQGVCVDQVCVFE